MENDRRDSSTLWKKLNEIHVDVIEVKGDVKAVTQDVMDHETILRGQSRTNGLVGDMKAIKTTANILKFATGGTITGIGAIWAFLKSQLH